MGSTINNFDRESLVMLYAAGELSAEDQKRGDQMLANDPALRAQLDELNAAQQVMTASFSQADAKLPMPAPMASSVRNVSRAMKQWHVDRLNAKSAPVARHGRRFGWMYSIGAVAAV